MKVKLLAKKMGAVLMAGMVLMSGCSTKEKVEDIIQEDVEVETSEEQTEDDGVEEAETEESEKEDAVTKEQKKLEEEINTAKIRHYYAGILSGLVCAYQWPDGSQVDSIDGDMGENQYSIVDIDGDGKEELLICFINTYMAAMVERVYAYDPESDTLQEELAEFPDVTYYDNGTVMAGWSHNQGLGETLWPFTLYQYDSSSDTYLEVASVDSWEKSYREQDYDGNMFPDELDTDGDGILYFINEPGNYSTERPVDKEEYDAWYQSYIGDAKPLNVSYRALDVENFMHYTSAYLELMRKQALGSGNSAKGDIGVFCMEKDFDIKEVERKITSTSSVTITEDEYGIEHIGICDGKEVFSFYYEDDGSFTYQNEKVGDLTIFGLYPGISEQDAMECLEKYGFYQSAEDFYITGEGLGNYGIYLNTQNGVVTRISFSGYCRFVG